MDTPGAIRKPAKGENQTEEAAVFQAGQGIEGESRSLKVRSSLNA
jgi:hypothetical protein